MLPSCAHTHTHILYSRMSKVQEKCQENPTNIKNAYIVNTIYGNEKKRNQRKKNLIDMSIRNINK